MQIPIQVTQSAHYMALLEMYISVFTLLFLLEILITGFCPLWRINRQVDEPGNNTMPRINLTPCGIMLLERNVTMSLYQMHPGHSRVQDTNKGTSTGHVWDPNAKGLFVCVFR